MDSFNKIILTFMFFLLINIALCPAYASNGCHVEERRALLNFKSFLKDPSGRLSIWQENVQHHNCCDWHGIRCSDKSLRVVSIDLRNNKLEDYINEFSYSSDFDPPRTALQGKLSPSLSTINHLEYLDLGFNDFQESEIPFRFSDLTKLTHLDLSFTNLSASVSIHFTNISSLHYLDLSCSTIKYYPYLVSCFESPSTKWIEGLVNLQVLRLSGIDLFEATSSKETFSQHISYLSNLRDLDISDCDISGPGFPIHQFHNLSRSLTLKMNRNNNFNFSIPLQLINLTSLSVLDLSDCDLQGSIPYLPRLQELHVSDNKDLCSDLTRMFEYRWPRLQKLDISRSNATGSIPSSISNALPLVSFSASNCSIQGNLPSSIYNLSRLQYLDLSNNNITSSIHSSISNLKDLKFLDLSLNNFQGSIPDSTCELFPLQHLDLWGNHITGTIPSCITKLRNLSYFEVSANSMEGNVSLISLINELNLTSLNLNYNNLTVVIDQHLYPSKFILKELQLDSCNMRGIIPTFICNFTNLKSLDLSFNNLTGVIPSCISKLKNLEYLILSKNSLRGPLPLLPLGINYLDLSQNKLSGLIPSSLCFRKPGMSYSKTGYIDLSNNKLSGIIPTGIRYCKSLYYLNLGNNHLKGNIPKELKHTNLFYLQLNDNNLNGLFPIFILELVSLRVLNLGNNNFEGILPVSLGSLNGLVILILRSNRFNGSIPEEIFRLQALLILDVSLNNFSGSIPLELGKLSSLTSGLSVSMNGFTVQYQLAIKGTTAQFEQSKIYSSGIDLSCNILKGNITEEIGLLQGLVMLNLSHNHLSSNIPTSVGNMSSLESLDLSSNRLSGRIPKSLTSIDNLGYLNISHNNLSGWIPRGNHFDTNLFLDPNIIDRE